MTLHKHAEILRAIADGKEVQFKGSNGEWIEPVSINPIHDSYLEWRIKPEPKPDAELYYNCSFGSGVVYCGKTGGIVFKPYNLRLTFDGETEKLKKAEIL